MTIVDVDFDCPADVAGGAMGIMPVRARTILDIAAVVILLAAAVYLGVHYTALPEGLDAHINGVPAHASHKQFAWLPIGVGVWSVVLLSFASWVMKDGTPMDDRLLRTPEQIARMRVVFSVMKVAVACCTAATAWSTVARGLGRNFANPWAYVSVFVGLLASLVYWLTAFIMKARRRLLVG